MNFILPMGDFLRKGGDVMLGDLVLEDSRLIVVRDQAEPLDASVIIRAETISGVGMGIQFQDKDGLNVGNIAGFQSGLVAIAAKDGDDVFIPSGFFNTTHNLYHAISGITAPAQQWWTVYNLMIN